MLTVQRPHISDLIPSTALFLTCAKIHPVFTNFSHMLYWENPRKHTRCSNFQGGDKASNYRDYVGISGRYPNLRIWVYQAYIRTNLGNFPELNFEFNSDGIPTALRMPKSSKNLLESVQVRLRPDTENGKPYGDTIIVPVVQIEG